MTKIISIKDERALLFEDLRATIIHYPVIKGE